MKVLLAALLGLGMACGIMAMTSDALEEKYLFVTLQSFFWALPAGVGVGIYWRRG